jgi:hypothetical protein
VGHYVTQPAVPRSAIRILRWLLSERDREALIGDLVEECALRSAEPAQDSCRWCWEQVGRSVLPLLQARIRRRGWPGKLGAAAAAYVVVAPLVVASDVVALELSGGQPAVQAWISFLAFVAALMLGGCLATSIRRGAAAPLAAIVMVMSALWLAQMPDRPSIWYQLGLLLAGPSSAVAGGRLRN